VLCLTLGARFVLLHLVVLLLWWFFNFAAPACLVVVDILHGSVGDVDCGRGVEKTTTRWLVILYLVEVPMAIFMSIFFFVVCCLNYPRCWMRCGIGVLMFYRLFTSLVCSYYFAMIRGGWIFSLDRWCEIMRTDSFKWCVQVGNLCTTHVYHCNRRNGAFVLCTLICH
jgi:hypothetical protein